MAQDDSLEQQIYDIEENIAPSKSMWPRYILLAVGIIGIGGVAFTPIYLWPTVTMAYINCMLYAFFASHFLKKGTLSALIPVISPIWMILGSCVGVIYFATFFPNEGYPTRGGFVSYFAGGIRYQLVIFIFLLMYFVVLSWVLRKDQPGEQSPTANTRYIGYAAIAMGIPIFALSAISFTFELPLFLKQWSIRLFIYYRTILFAAGVVFDRLSKVVKIILFCCLGVISFLYLFRGARGMALGPIAALFIGVFFFSKCRKQTKTAWLTGIIAFSVFYMLVGSTIRILLGPGGAGEYSLATRWSALKDWKSAVTGKPVFGSVFGRLFFTAGNAVIAYTPSRYAYRDFSPAKYAKEFAIYMMPEPLIRRVINLEPGKLSIVLKTEYTRTTVLNEYGILVSEATSVEVSMIGHFWMLGGYFYVVCGGIMVGLLHGVVAWIIRRAWARDPDKGVFYFAVLLYSITMATLPDFIGLTRLTFLTLFFAFIGYKLVKPFIGMFYASPVTQHEESIYEDIE